MRPAALGQHRQPGVRAARARRCSRVSGLGPPSGPLVVERESLVRFRPQRLYPFPGARVPLLVEEEGRYLSFCTVLAGSVLALPKGPQLLAGPPGWAGCALLCAFSLTGKKKKIVVKLLRTTCPPSAGWFGYFDPLLKVRPAGAEQKFHS